MTLDISKLSPVMRFKFCEKAMELTRFLQLEQMYINDDIKQIPESSSVIKELKNWSQAAADLEKEIADWIIDNRD